VLRAALLALALSACVHGLPPGSPDAQAVSAVEAAWRASGLPSPGDCLELVEVRRHQSLSAYVDACDGGRPGLYGAAARDSAGCLTSALRGVIGRRVWIVNVAPGYHTDPTIVGHELRHALTACHLDRPRSDPFDAGHSDLRVWASPNGPAHAVGSQPLR
jgi:hypothetical protein